MKLLHNIVRPQAENRDERSKRVLKEISLTVEKNEAMCKKRNLEGTNLSTQNAFFALSQDAIVEISSQMGAIICDGDFAKVELHKDLEIARHILEVRNH
jgi:hypothetical protein